MQFNIKNKVGARFKLIVHSGDGIPVRETEWFHNLVLDSGLSRMSEGTWIDRCCVGTGNSAPMPTQVALDNFIASTTQKSFPPDIIQDTNGENPHYGVRNKWSFGAGVAAGNISEVGLGWGNSSLWNRSLVKDSSGNPTTITVLSDEYLDIIAEIRVYPNPALSGEFNLINKNGDIISTHNYIGMPLIYNVSNYLMSIFDKINLQNICIYNGNIGESANTIPSGTALANAIGASVTHPTLTSARGVASLNLSTANGLHKSITVAITNLLQRPSSSSYPAPNIGYKLEIDPPITKLNSQIMSYTFEMSWDRYEPA